MAGHKYPYRRAKATPLPETAQAPAPPPPPPIIELDPQEALRRLVARLKVEGYEPIHWIRNPKGVRANLPGKRAIPSSYTKNRVCVRHGNLVKLRHEVQAGRDDTGVRILDVLPCLFCCPNAAEIIERSPKTEG